MITSSYAIGGEDWIEVARQLAITKQKRKDLEELEGILSEKLKELSNNKSTCGDIYKFSLTYRSGSIDYGSIPELKTVNLELYRKAPISMWKLEILAKE